MSQEPEEPIERGETFTKELLVDITDEDKDGRKNRLADVVLELAEIDAKKAEAMSGFNKELKDKRKEMNALAAAIRTGQEKKELDCFERFDFRRNVVETRRSDTEEVIDERAMTMDERQERLPGTEGEDEPSSVTRIPPGVAAPKGRKGKKAAADAATEEAVAH